MEAERTHTGFRSKITADVHREIVLNDRIFDSVMEHLKTSRDLGGASFGIRRIFLLYNPFGKDFDVEKIDWTAITKSLAKAL